MQFYAFKCDHSPLSRDHIFPALAPQQWEYLNLRSLRTKPHEASASRYSPSFHTYKHKVQNIFEHETLDTWISAAHCWRRSVTILKSLIKLFLQWSLNLFFHLPLKFSYNICRGFSHQNSPNYMATLPPALHLTALPVCLQGSKLEVCIPAASD